MHRNTMDQIKKAALKTTMNAKLNKTARWTYHPKYLPKNTTNEAIIQGMKSFIVNNLDEALEKSAEVLPLFSQQDSQSIGTDKPTENARTFIALLYFIEQNGFPGPATFAKPINFYSGKEAQIKAYQNSDELSLIEGMIPCFTVVYDLWYAVQPKPDSALIFCTLSRMLAAFAQGDVNIYLSSDNATKSAGFVAGSYLWDVELPILQRSYLLPEAEQEKRITKIMIHLYDQVKKAWNSPISLHSKEILNIPVYIKESEQRYKPAETASNSTSVTLRYLKHIGSIWRNAASVKMNPCPKQEKVYNPDLLGVTRHL